MSSTASTTRLWAWIRASRFPSQSYIAPPLLLGQCLSLASTGALDWMILLWVQLFGLCDQLFIVYGNDYADRETDALNDTATLFSGGSRVLVEQVLSPAALLRASKWAAAATLACTAVIALAFNRLQALPLGLLALAMLWAYSYRPLSLSYRGGGEFLQMLGVGLCLPLFGYYSQAGSLAAFPWPVMLALLPTHLACGMATSLPDEPSDRTSGKRTTTVLLGARTNRALIVALNGLAILALWNMAPLAGIEAQPALLVAALVTSGAHAIGPVGAPGSTLLTVRVALAVATTLLIVLSLLATGL